MTSALLTAIYALSAAASWGVGDFGNGLATRRVGALYSVFISYSIGLLSLLTLALAFQEPIPSGADLFWGALAGLAGLVGLGFMLRGFELGRMGVVAPISGVLAAAFPVVISAFTQGLPDQNQLIGFAMALVGIWLLARPEKISGSSLQAILMAMLSGVGFGVFFTVLDQVSENTVFWPLVAGRLVSIVAMLIITLARRRPLLPQNPPWTLHMIGGLLDVAGNFFFLLATQTGRLDVAAVLGSLYPAVTAILARLVADEHLTRLQIAGVAAAVLAIALIAL